MRILLCLGLGISLAMPCLAQECHSLNGTWKLNRALTNFATVKSPDQQAESMTVAIQQTGQTIAESWILNGSQITGAFSYRFEVNGVEQKLDNAAQNRQMPTSVLPAWQNCTLIVEEKRPFFNGSSMTMRRTYVVSAGGKQLTILEESHSVFADTERNLVFDSIP
jgi:hypothetical protein